MKKSVLFLALALGGCFSYRPIPAPVLLDANDVCKHFDGLAQVEVTDDRSFWGKADKQPNQLLKVVYWYTATCNDTTVVSRRVEIHS